MAKKKYPKNTRDCRLIDEHFIEMLEDGSMVIKDGRTLEEYLNSDYLKRQRRIDLKKSKLVTPYPMVLMSLKDAREYAWRASIPHSA
jgi:hypothetical protein